jgi:hypothetical protein
MTEYNTRSRYSWNCNNLYSSSEISGRVSGKINSRQQVLMVTCYDELRFASYHSLRCIAYQSPDGFCEILALPGALFNAIFMHLCLT